jgi:hypothetical protein
MLAASTSDRTTCVISVAVVNTRCRAAWRPTRESLVKLTSKRLAPFKPVSRGSASAVGGLVF